MSTKILHDESKEIKVILLLKYYIYHFGTNCILYLKKNYLYNSIYIIFEN
jgi:hypothetical protein